MDSMITGQSDTRISRQQQIVATNVVDEKNSSMRFAARSGWGYSDNLCLKS